MTLSEDLGNTHCTIGNTTNSEVGEVSFCESDWDDLFRTGSPPLWAIVDGVNCPEISQRLTGSEAQHACLYTSTDPGTLVSAPWLVHLEPESDMLKWLKRLPQDQHWGIMLQSQASLKDLRAHLRKFTMLWTPADEQAPVYFRFYDPRVAVDMAQALEPWKLSRFMAPIKRIIAPLSPLIVLPAEIKLDQYLAIDADRDEYKGRMVVISISGELREEEQMAKSFSISQIEFERFGVLQKIKAQKKMARDMMSTYPHYTAEMLLKAVERAVAIGQTHDMTSRKQTRTLAKCVLEFGDDCVEVIPALANILEDRQLEAWQRRMRIEEWIPRGRIRRDFAKKKY